MNKSSAEKKDSWYGNLFLAALCFYLSFDTYRTLMDVENGHSHYVNSMLAFVYATVGVYPTVVLVIAAGIFFLFEGVKSFLKTKSIDSVK